MLIRFVDTHGYYFFLGVGAVSMLYLLLQRRKLYGMNCIKATILCVLLLLCGIAGAKLLYFFESGLQSFSGMSFFGSVYLVLIFMPVIGLFFRFRPAQSLDACAPCVASIIGFMRFGCLCAGCCGGITAAIGNFRFIWPTQLIEGIGDMLILLLLLNFEHKSVLKGKLYPVFLIAYGIQRFFIEFLRDTPKNWFHLSHGQWFSVLGIILAVVIILGDAKWKKVKSNN